MKLLPRELLRKTGPVDEADWVYRPILGQISRIRFRMICRMLAGGRYPRLLEIGYGSGVFLPELGRYCDELHGIDVHSMPEAVSDAAAKAGVQAVLKTSGAENMPYPDGYFDCAVAVSSLEFVRDLEAVCREIKRVLRPDGSFLFVTPGSSPVLDLGLKILTGNDAKKDFGRRREIVVPTMERHFRFERKMTAPALPGSVFRLYLGARCTPQQEQPAY